MSLDAATETDDIATGPDTGAVDPTPDSGATQNPATPPQDGTASEGGPPPSDAATQPWYQRLGVNAESEDAAYQAVQQQLQERNRLAQQVQAWEPYARRGYEVQNNFAAYQQFLQQQGLAGNHQPSAAEKSEQKPFWADVWNPPEFKSDIADFWMDRDPTTGQPTGWKQNAPAEVIQSYLDHQSYRREAAEQFWSNPHEFIRKSPAMEDFRTQLMSEITEQVRAELNAQNVIRDVSAFEQQNASWLYQADQNGQIVRDQLTGHAIPSAAGGLFMQNLKLLRDSGIEDPAKLQELGLALTEAEILRRQQAQPPVAAAPPVTPPSPADALANGNRNFNRQQNSAVRTPSRGAAAAPGAVDDGRGLSLGEKIRREVSAANVSLSSN